MAINFPDSPTNGQVATIGGKNYTYNSTKNTWTPTQVTEADLSSVGSTTVVATHDLLPSSPSAGDMALVSSVNKMYVYFLSGWWLMSSLQNASPSGITGNAAIYDLATDGTPTTVTLSSSDPEGFPISWSHSVISGSLGGTTVTNVDNVFTITPSTDAADAGTFTLRFAASDGQGGESGSQSQFTLDFVFTVTNSRYTTLLATAVDTSDNNNITDASSNSHTIAVNGDAHAGTFSPYRSGGYSTYFDGSGDYLTLPNTTASVGTNDFTLEAWAYTTTTSTSGVIFKAYSSGTEIEIRQFNDDTYMSVNGADGSRTVISGSNNITPYVWHHYAIVRDNGIVYGYLDGALVGSVNYANDISGNLSTRIGADQAGGTLFNGYITDLRLVNGTAITPPSGGPTERLEAVTNTSLLTCHLPYIADGSTNDHSITINGNTSTKPFSPYDYENEYSATDHGGSVYFDGSADYLLINSPPTLGANDWTFETWYYISNPLTANNVLLSQGPGNNTVVSSFSVSSTGEIWIQTYTGTNVVLYNTAAGIIKGGVWNHIVLTHEYDGSNGGTYKIYVNGNQVGSDVSYTSGHYWNLGGISGTPLAMAQYRYNTQANSACYFSDWKISNSVTYSSNFTPPTAPLSSSGASLHIKGTDASIIDKSQSTNLKLVGNTTGSTTQAKFSNTKSMYFDGTGDYAQLPVGSSYLGSSDFTIEAWIYQDANAGTGASSHIIYSDWLNTNNDKSIILRITDSSGQKVQFLYSTDGSSSTNYASTSSISNSTWTHLAVCKDSTSLRLYIDGVSEVWASSPSFTLNPNEGAVGPLIGGNYDAAGAFYGQFFDGYIQDFRITEGLARYTANFTPPTEPLEG